MKYIGASASTRGISARAASREVGGVEDVADAPGERGPQEVGPSPARLRRVVVAHREALGERPRDRLDHLTQRDVRRGARQRVAATGPPLAGHDLGAAQTAEDLLEVARGDALAFADHADLHRVAVAVVGQVEHPADGVLHLERETHARRVPDPGGASTGGIR
jgi:hypothetical protein